jgi:hypothetical protein
MLGDGGGKSPHGQRYHMSADIQFGTKADYADQVDTYPNLDEHNMELSRRADSTTKSVRRPACSPSSIRHLRGMLQRFVRPLLLSENAKPVIIQPLMVIAVFVVQERPCFYRSALWVRLCAASHSSLSIPYSSRSSSLSHFRMCCLRVPSCCIPSFCIILPEAGLRLK